ncbi:MAG: PorV/PorQ family protein [Candidatus Fermentibacter daniensis]|nr:PorV/PorQ family protein [Candidatus Fermentibacter daniensis]HOG53912.1 PorV/PorQ family protein [Candidatus Fermentibacter daniensis]
MKLTGRILIAAAAVLLLFPASADASFAKVGTAGAQFLKLGLGTRGAAMGGAFVATADDASAAWWNPACLVRVPGTQVQLTHTEWFEDVRYEAGVVTREFPAIGTFALQFGLLSSGDMNVITVEHPEGTGETFTCNDMVVGLTYSRMLTDRFSTGVTFKYVREGWDDISASGLAVDLGTLYNTGFRTLRIGMTIQHFGGELTPSGEFDDYYSGSDSLKTFLPYSLPMTFKLGFAMDVLDEGPHFMTIAVDGVHPNDNTEQVNIGGEYWYNGMVALRGGYRVNTDEEGLTAGAGFRIPVSGRTIALDYAYADFNRLDMVHRASLGFEF